MPVKKKEVAVNKVTASPETVELFKAYTKVRKDFLENVFPFMSGGDRVMRKNINWFLMNQVEELTDKIEQEKKAKKILKDS